MAVKMHDSLYITANPPGGKFLIDRSEEERGKDVGGKQTIQHCGQEPINSVYKYVSLLTSISE